MIQHCKNCTFEHEPLQCFVGRLDLLKENKSSKVEEVDGHYVISGKLCDWSTPRYWTNPDLKDIAWKVRQNRILKVPFIITTNKGSTFEEISRTVRSLQNQQVKPHSIHIINKSSVDPKRLLALKDDIPLTIQQIVLDDYIERYVWTKVEKLDQTYYGVICGGFELPVDFIRKLDQTYNDEMNHFVYLEYQKFVEIHSTILSHEVGGDFIETKDGYRYKDKVAAWCERNQLDGLIEEWK